MIYNLLYDWQKEVVNKLAAKRAFGLWLDCGLGKTVQALALAEKNRATKILIVTTNAKACEKTSTPGSWQQWSTKLGPDWIIRSKKQNVAMRADSPSPSASPDSRTDSKLDNNSQTVNSSTESFDAMLRPGAVQLPRKSRGKKDSNLVVSAQVTASDLPVKEVTLKQTDKFNEWEKCVYITNYESTFVHGKAGSRTVLKPEILDFISSCRGQSVTLLLDESHYIKDPSSTQATALSAIKRELMVMTRDLHIYLLTGTPFTRGFIDVWNQLKFLGCTMNKTEFKNNFCVMGNIKGLLGWQQPIVGYKNLDSLYKLIHQYAITLKSEDVLNLPEQVFTYHTHPAPVWFTVLTRERLPIKTVINMNNVRKNLGLPVISDQYISHLVDVWAEEHGHTIDDSLFQIALKQNISVQNPWYRNIDYPEMNYLCDTAGSLWMRARQLSIGFQGNAEAATWYDSVRIAQIKNFLAEYPDNYVLFYNYVPEFTELFDICVELGYNIDVWNGDIKSLDNYERYVKESPEKQVVDKKNIILSNFASGSTGMNWQAYSQCIVASLPTYKHWAQGLKRVHRNGSKETVIYHIFRSSSWLDDGMWESLMSGTEYSQEMFNKALNEAQPEI